MNPFENRSELVQDLTRQASESRELKREIKEKQRTGSYSNRAYKLPEIKQDLRSRTLALAFLNGTPYSVAESRTKRAPNFYAVQRYVQQLLPEMIEPHTSTQEVLKWKVRWDHWIDEACLHLFPQGTPENAYLALGATYVSDERSRERALSRFTRMRTEVKYNEFYINLPKEEEVPSC